MNSSKGQYKIWVKVKSKKRFYLVTTKRQQFKCCGPANRVYRNGYRRKIKRKRSSLQFGE